MSKKCVANPSSKESLLNPYIVQVRTFDAVDLLEIPVDFGNSSGELDHVAAAGTLLVGGAESARGAVHEIGAEGILGDAPLVGLDQLLAAQPSEVAPQIFPPRQILGLKVGENGKFAVFHFDSQEITIS